MVDVGNKNETERVALARGRIFVGEEAFLMIKSGTLPKGDVLSLAEAAGICAAKQTSSLLPLCHPISLSAVSLWFEFDEERYEIIAFCEAKIRARTGVEMEALCGVNGALLCVYDLVKPVNPALVVREALLLRKEGGKSGIWTHPEDSGAADKPHTTKEVRDHLLEGVSVAGLVASDSISRGDANDTSGEQMLEHSKRLGAKVADALVIVPDEISAIRRVIAALVERSDVDVVLVSGGTGPGPRDVTPEALDSCGVKMIPGIGEVLRAEGRKKTPFAILSRGGGGVLNGKLVIALPGSPKAVHEGLDVVAPLVKHIVSMARGGGHNG
jgi:molybdenum cofactor biosynthesis protein MoaC